MADSSLHFSLDPVDNDRLANLCGRHDDNIKTLARLLNVIIQRRGEHFQIQGSNGRAKRAVATIKRLYSKTSAKDKELNLEQLRTEIEDAQNGIENVPQADQKIVAGFTLRSKTQHEYEQAINTNDITFGIGASGTGKTFVAMACAIQALTNGQVRKIVLVRPAVEAGESLGYLPGDPVQKVNPYLRPLQDALHELTKGKNVDNLFRDRIELAPLAFMRGRTLTNSFVILDEAQNATVAQMLMFLTRLGRNSRCVVTGDETQIDLPTKQKSGLVDVLGRIKSVEGCAVVKFSAHETMRHPIVERILQAYQKDSSDESKTKK